jgi:hypothetical protein
VRRLVTLLVVLSVLLVVADRVGVAVASRVVASKLRSSAQLKTDPSVNIRGFPFLTQAISGRYDDIDVSATDLARGGVRLSRLEVSLRGVRLTVSQALSGNVSAVPVEGITASVIVTYADIAKLGTLTGITVAPVGSHVRVTAHLTVLGQTVTATSDSTVRLEGRFIVITAQKVTVLGQSSGMFNSALAGRLDLRVPVGNLPYGLALTGVHVSSGGLVLSARAGPTVIPVRPPV